MRFAITCLLRGHKWHPWSFNGVRSRRYCPRCRAVRIVDGKDMAR